MIQNSINTTYAKIVAEKFREAQNYLRANGFSRSTKNLLEDIDSKSIDDLTELAQKIILGRSYHKT